MRARLSGSRAERKLLSYAFDSRLIGSVSPLRFCLYTPASGRTESHRSVIILKLKQISPKT